MIIHHFGCLQKAYDAQFDDDRLWNEKALADRKRDNNNTTNKNNVGGAWGPVPGSKKCGAVKWISWH